MLHILFQNKHYGLLANFMSVCFPACDAVNNVMQQSQVDVLHILGLQ